MPHLPHRPVPGARISNETHRVTTFELFFDLVFVFAFTQVTEFMVHEHSFLGVLQGMVILVLLWWSWAPFSWLANQAHADEGLMRFGLCAVMVAVFIAALAIPEAFNDLAGGLSGPLVLAVTYTAVRVLHLVLYAYAAGNDRPLRRQIGKLTIVAVLGAALVITGALLGGSAQTWFWLAGMVLDTVITFFISRHGSWRIHSAAHWTERHGLVVILALGESIVAIGVGASQVPVSVPVLTGAAAGICLSIVLWWLYFDVMAIAAEHRFAALRGSARSAAAVEAYTYLHLPLVAGIILAALGVEDALAHVEDSKALSSVGYFALFAGPALYVLSSAVFWRRMGAGWKKWRLGTAAVLLGVLAVHPRLTSLTVLILVTAVIAALVAVESMRYAGDRAASAASRRGHERGCTPSVFSPHCFLAPPKGTTMKPEDAPVEISLPFTGTWKVENSPLRRVPSHGTHLLATTYAIDFVGVDDAGRTAPRVSWRTAFATEPPELFFAFGRPILAPVSGEVVTVHDGEADHGARRSQLALIPYKLGQPARLRQGAGAIAGNYVLIAVPGGGAVVGVMHLRSGSIRVRAGQQVSEGERIGDCGNSGNSTQPHVHVQAMDGTDPWTARGLPLVFRSFDEKPVGARTFTDRWNTLPDEASTVRALQ